MEGNFEDASGPRGVPRTGARGGKSGGGVSFTKVVPKFLRDAMNGGGALAAETRAREMPEYDGEEEEDFVTTDLEALKAHIAQEGAVLEVDVPTAIKKTKRSEVSDEALAKAISAITAKRPRTAAQLAEDMANQIAKQKSEKEAADALLDKDGKPKHVFRKKDVSSEVPTTQAPTKNSKAAKKAAPKRVVNGEASAVRNKALLSFDEE